jgi:prevent-host-death family protein
MARVQLVEDIQPLSEFRSHATAFVKQVRTTGRPLVITHHGKSAAVLLDVTNYELLLEKIDLLEDIQKAEAQLATGSGIEHDAALRQISDRLTV